ncbi:MAG: saccharopine dehydrogenase family protein [Pikeienuella sp.]
MAQIHWCGAGLSAVPGLRRLIENGHSVTVWNRSVDRAEAAVAGLTGDFTVRAFTLEALTAALGKGDLAVSMLPGDFHVPIAQACLNANAHFVSSSYISPEMRALHDQGKTKGLSLVNEVGLDPGLDHSMAHDLVAAYRASDAYDADNTLSFYSYCGGLSETPNDFKYKFSWSPLGVLKALKSPSKSLRNGVPFDVDRPWNAISNYTLDLPTGAETFQVYPNRDSLPFMEDYKFDASWNVDTFVRGTLRYGGWSDAWSEIFEEVETLSGTEGDARLAEMSADLWDKYSISEGEADRVVLTVELRADRDGAPVWQQAWRMDAYGDAEASAMAKLVSLPVTLAVEAVLAGEIGSGVTAAPSAPDLVARWLDCARQHARYLQRVDLL